MAHFEYNGCMILLDEVLDDTVIGFDQFDAAYEHKICVYAHYISFVARCFAVSQHLHERSYFVPPLSPPQKNSDKFRSV